MYAAMEGHRDIVTILLQLGASINNKSIVSYMLDIITIVINTENLRQYFYFN